MISIESHSKQIKLLNQYIAALEKQVAAARTEAQEQQKGNSQQAEDLRLMNEDINKYRNQNAQLKFNLARQDQNIRRLLPFEKQFMNMREQVQRGAAEYNKLLLQFQQVQQNNKNLEERAQSLDLQLKKKTESFTQASQKDKQEIEELKKSLIEKDRQKEDMVRQLTTEKRNSSARISALEGSSNDLLKIKNEAISKLSKDLQELKLRYNRDMTSNSQTRNSLGEQIKQLINTSNETKNQLISTKKDLAQTKQLLEKKTSECDDFIGKLKAKTTDYETLSKSTNQQKIVLLRNIQRLDEQKNKLETMNSACKGNINQTTKALGDSLKRSQQLSKQLFDANQQISLHKDTITHHENQITRLTNNLSDANKEILKMTEEGKVREEYIISLKGEIDRAKKWIEELEELKSNNLSSIGQLDHKTNKLKSELFEKQKQLQQKSKLIEENKILIAKNNSQINNLEIDKKEQQFLITKLTTEVQSHLKTISMLKAAKEQLEGYLDNYKSKNQELDERLIKLIEELELTKQHKSHVQKQRQDLIKRQSQILQQKLGDKDLLTQQISSRDKRIQQLTERYQKLQSLNSAQSRNNTQTIKKLQAEKSSLTIVVNQNNIEIEGLKKKIQQLQTNLNKTKQTLQLTIQQYNTYRKKKQTQTEQLSNQLKQSQKKNEKRAAKIEQLNQEISVLENTHTNERKNLGDSQKEEIERQKAKFKQTIIQLKNEHNEQINKKITEISQLNQLIQKISQQNEKNLKANRDQYLTKQKAFNEVIKNLETENKNLEKEVRRLNFATISQSQTKNSKQFELETLRKSMERLEGYSKQQKNTIQQLNKLLQSKTTQIESLESSNTMLRKQVISALNNEESSRKQLLQTKSKVNSVVMSSTSKNSIKDFAGVSKLEAPTVKSNVIYKKNKTTFTNKSIDLSIRSKMRPSEKQKTLGGEKMKESLVEDLSESNFNDFIKEIQVSKD